MPAYSKLSIDIYYQLNDHHRDFCATNNNSHYSLLNYIVLLSNFSLIERPLYITCPENSTVIADVKYKSIALIIDGCNYFNISKPQFPPFRSQNLRFDNLMQLCMNNHAT